MRFLSDTVIKVDRELSELDRFALDVVEVLLKHTSYVIVSGYVSILLGRARASEDVDIIIPQIPADTLQRLSSDLAQSGFESITSSLEEVPSYLAEGLAVRFARIGTVIPNIELKVARHRFDDLSLARAVTVQLPGADLRISPLDLQIAFKEAVLRSPKDLEDAAHLRTVAHGHVDEDQIDTYKEQLHAFFYGRQ